MKRFRAAAFLILVALASPACSTDIVGVEPSLEGLPAGLQVALTVEPGIVTTHAPFTVRLTVTNTTAGELTVVTAHGCLATPHVLRGGTRVPFEGSWWGCTAAITTHDFAPGETRTREWEMRAELYSEHPGDVDGAPAATGTYRVQAEFDTYSPADPTRKPAIERALIVR